MTIVGLPPVASSLHSRWSAMVYDPGNTPPSELLNLGLRAAQIALTVRLDPLAQRATPVGNRGWVQPEWINCWPGEHYRLLAALASEWRPERIVEVGTAGGAGLLALQHGAPEAHLVTYDIVPWHEIDQPLLRSEDFGPRVEQRIGDLTEPKFWDMQAETFSSADIIFIDGPHTGEFERRLCQQILRQVPKRPQLLILDDIRWISMIPFWSWLPLPKWDITSLGHWSGTGLALHDGTRAQTDSR